MRLNRINRPGFGDFDGSLVRRKCTIVWPLPNIMFSRLLDKALVKLEIKDSEHQTNAKAAESSYPTLTFTPPRDGIQQLCSRCLTLLTHFTKQFGDGRDYEALSITHSAAIRDMSHAVHSNGSVARKNTIECVICTKVYILFRAMQAHVSFEDAWRTSPSTDWSLMWVADRQSYESQHDERLHVKFSVKHRRGYTWGTGGFMLYPEGSNCLIDYERKLTVKDVPHIRSLQSYRSSATDPLSLDSSSTLGPGTLPLVSTWIQDCVASHSKCRRIFGSDDLSQPAPWFPDRLIQVRRKHSGALIARLVLKTDTKVFPSDNGEQLKYLSLSHCWGPPPNPTARLGGRADSVLTAETLPQWIDVLPVNSLPLAFQHAITACAWLDFEFIWIDSLCILQDSKEDWEIQSAVMGDVYKFAFFNIAALSSLSDYEGFINTRDNRVTFGFSCSFTELLGRNAPSPSQQGQPYALLKNNATLLWDFSGDIQGSTDSNTPLFTRAWVYQERNLARRTLAFANTTVYWSCDEVSCSERGGWGGFSRTLLRQTLHTADTTIHSPSLDVPVAQHAQNLITAFDRQWNDVIRTYTACKLTKHTDKLVAVSSVARELSNTKIMQQQRYLAGFWDINLLSQLGWITIVGKQTPARKQYGDKEYVAPSWSWASVEAPVQSRSFLAASPLQSIPLAEVLGAEVELASKFKFGAVKAGWVRLRGILRPADNLDMLDRYGKSLSLRDQATKETFWFSSDTTEGIELVRKGQAQKLVWMPLFATFDTAVSGSCLVLLEVRVGPQYGGSGAFVRPGERVYRRMGTGNFGRSIDMLRPTDLVWSLGAYAEFDKAKASGTDVARGFRRREEGMQKFVLI